MTSTSHALVGGAIANAFTDPILAGALALTSHYIMDSIPHWDFGTNWRERPKYITGMIAIIDTVFGIGISYAIFGRSLPLTLWASTVVLSLLPDWLETPWYICFANNTKRVPQKHASLFEKFAYSLYKIPNVFHTKAQLPLGIVTQVATVAFFIVLLG